MPSRPAPSSSSAPMSRIRPAPCVSGAFHGTTASNSSIAEPLPTRSSPSTNGAEQSRTDADRYGTGHKGAWEEPDVLFLGFAGDPNTAYFLAHDEGDWGVLRG